MSSLKIIEHGDGMSAYPKVVAIILNWNGKADTVECLDSLEHTVYPNYKIIVVDNASTDGSIELFKDRYPGIKIIRNPINLGYAEGNNVGIREAIGDKADYVLILNNDTVVDPNLITELVAVAERVPNVGFVGPKNYYYERGGRKDVINFAGGTFSICRGTTYNIGMNEVDKGQHDEIKESNYIPGSCVMVKREVIEKIGLINPEYFTYWEDTDWCVRALKAGYRSVYVPKAKIWHKIGVQKGKKNIKAYYYFGRNIFLLVKKHASLPQLVIFMLYYFGFKVWLTSSVSLFYHKDMNEAVSFLRGVKEGTKILMGP
jgi:GT2 family glycosyltransferase